MSEADTGFQPDGPAAVRRVDDDDEDAGARQTAPEQEAAQSDEPAGAARGEPRRAEESDDLEQAAEPDEPEGPAQPDGPDEGGHAADDRSEPGSPAPPLLDGERPLPADTDGEPALTLEDMTTAFHDRSDAPGIDETPAPEDELDVDAVAEAATSHLVFVDVLIVLPSSNPVVILQEADSPYRELRIPIGGPEGVAIGYAARRIATPRPLTHELMSLILRDFDLTLEVVRITGCSGGSFTAEIVVSGPLGARTIDCRPSDAIALALRQRLPVPIVALPGVLEQAGLAAAGSN